MAVWGWLLAAEHRSLLALWMESYARSLIEPDGPWAGFAEQTVRDWLTVLAGLQPPRSRRGPAAEAERTLVLAVLRGALQDLLATGDVAAPPELFGWASRHCTTRTAPSGHMTCESSRA